MNARHIVEQCAVKNVDTHSWCFRRDKATCTPLPREPEVVIHIGEHLNESRIDFYRYGCTQQPRSSNTPL